MSRILLTLVALVLLLSSVPVFAQDLDSEIPPLLQLVQNTTEAAGNLECFDYYSFGSVQADLQANLPQAVSGTSLYFSGEIVNENPYPLVDGTLYVKIFKKDESIFAEGDGNPVVDQFVVIKDVALPAGGSKEASFEWRVPANAEVGEYYAAYFFATNNRYNLLGLSFTDDVVGNQASFSVTSDTESVAKLSKLKTTLNGQDHKFAAFPLQFEPGEEVTIRTVITNQTDQEKIMPLQWNQYAWDSMNPENLRNTQTELVTVPANSETEVSYTVDTQRESVVYVTATTQDKQAKSVLNIRYIQNGIEETRINFPSVTKFPLVEGQEQTLFACAHSTNLPNVPGNTLTLSLTDKTGNIIHEYIYQGDISGAMGGFGETFTPSRDYNYALLTATLERDGVLVEEVAIEYDCQIIDADSCLPESEQAGNGFLDKLMNNPLISFIAISLLLALFFVLSVHRRHKIGPDVTAPNNDMTTPISLLFFVLLIPAFLISFAPEAEAATVQWQGNAPALQGAAIATDFCYGNCDNGDQDRWRVSETKAVPLGSVQANTISVMYESYVRNNTKGGQFDNGAVEVGDNITFVPRAAGGGDINWVGTGYWGDSPNGFWGGSGASCVASQYISSQSLPGATVDNHVAFRVTPSGSPSISKTGTAGLSCDASGFNCTVTSPGTISATITWPNAIGRFYYAGNKTGQVTPAYQDWVGAGCNRVSFPLYQLPAGCSFDWTTADLNAAGSCLMNQPGYEVQVTPQSITHTINANAGNAAPNAPTINGTIGGTFNGEVNTDYYFDFNATDPDGDQITYGIDLDNNGTVDTGSPFGTPVNSGTTQNIHVGKWPNPGSYPIQAQTFDTRGGISGWTSYQVVIASPLLPPPPACSTPNIERDSASACQGEGYDRELLPKYLPGSASARSAYNNWIISGTTNQCAHVSGTGMSKGLVQAFEGGSCGLPPPVTACTYTLIQTCSHGNCVPESSVRALGYGYNSISASTEYEVNINGNAARYGTSCVWSDPSGTLNTNFAKCASNKDYTVDGVTFTVGVRGQNADQPIAYSTFSGGSCVLLPPPPVAANLTINGSTGPLDVPRGTPLTIDWSSTNATNCSAYWLAGAPNVGTSGTNSQTANGSNLYVIDCDGAQSSVQVNVVNQNPNPPTITYTSGTTEPNQNITFSIVGTDPDNDTIYYEIDWDNDGVGPFTATPGTGYVNSGTTRFATRSWPTTGSQTFRARTVDNASPAGRSTWTTHTINISAGPPPATAELDVQVNGGAWINNPTQVTINVGDTVNIGWRATGSTGCSATAGTGFAASGTSGWDAVTPPGSGASENFSVSCAGAGGPGTDIVRIITNLARPNLYPARATNNPGVVDPVTGNYQTIDLIFDIANNGNGDATPDFSYRLDIDYGADGSFSTNAASGIITTNISANDTNGARTAATLTNFPFGNFVLRVLADTTNAVIESDEGDNSRDFSFTLPPADPGINLEADRIQVRSGDSVTLTWTAVLNYPMNCTVTGPTGVNVSTTDFSWTPPDNTEETGPISSKSEFTLSCIEPLTSTTFTDRVIVETVGEVQEI